MRPSLQRVVAILVLVGLASPVAFAAKADKKKKGETAGTEAPPPAFAKVDKDGNGSVSQSEYVAALKSEIGEDAAKLRFGALDKNFDGQLSKDEYNSTPPEAPKEKKKKTK
jgi:hypothetical protein